MAGWSPFQFSSKKMQEKTTSGLLGGISLKGDFANAMSTAFSWYEMWINPEKMTISTSYIQKQQHTAGSIVTYHYRQDTPKMSVSGQCGWIGIESQSDGLSFGQKFQKATGKKITSVAWKHSSKTGNPLQMLAKSNIKVKTKDVPKFTGNAARKIGGSDNSDNSPRVFLGRLKAIADEPMYFLDFNGVEHYNIKLIKIFTKQFPDGVICEGFYTSFNIPEASEDVQTISYDFEFIIERITPISLIEQNLSMFGLGDSKKQQIGGLLRGGS